jgi:predicted transposase/invertase (TIGR01784 family)
LKNLESFNHIPAILNEPIFQKGFEIAEISHLNIEQYEQYKKSLVQYLEVKNVFDTAFEEGEKVGIEKGIERGVEKVAKALKEQNVPIEIIVESTGLSYEAIQRI